VEIILTGGNCLQDQKLEAVVKLSECSKTFFYYFNKSVFKTNLIF
jgi:hypothetical protein